MSVVGSDFEELKQFNLAEIYDPTPKPCDAKKTNDATQKLETKETKDEHPASPIELSPRNIPNHLASEDQEASPTAADPAPASLAIGEAS